MKKTLIIITAVIACIIVAIAGLILAYTRSSDYTADHLPQKTSINGIDCSNLTYDEAFSQLSDEWNKKTLTVEEVLTTNWQSLHILTVHMTLPVRYAP